MTAAETTAESKLIEAEKDGPAVLFSIGCHLLLLLLLALLTSGGEGDGPLTLFATFSDGADADAGLEEIGSIEIDAAADTPALAELTDLSEMAPGQLPAIDVGDLSGATAPNAGLADGSGSTGSLSSAVPGVPGADFFGVSGRGRTFVYVIDCSTSMLEMGKFEHAKQELLRSIRALKPNQKYLIVLFSDGAYPMDDLEPIKASPQNLARTAQWLYTLEPEGGTNPLPALMYALALKPSAVFFLSDGRFEPVVIETVRREDPPSRRQIPIHTLAFYTRQTEGMMKALARVTGGTYKFVEPPAASTTASPPLSSTP